VRPLKLARLDTDLAIVGKIYLVSEVLQAVMLHPKIRQVIPPAPEMVIKSDGDTKNDCERCAGKRLVGKIRAEHPKLKIMVTCDGLYSKQPFIDVLKAHGTSFVLAAKPTDQMLYRTFWLFS
jgi:hypothetical protein